jgi:DNA-binding MarR family transcriptional regulator
MAGRGQQAEPGARDRGGLLERVTGPGRAVRHAITPAGERARRAGSDIMDGVLGESLGSLSPGERATLYRLLTAAINR